MKPDSANPLTAIHLCKRCWRTMGAFKFSISTRTAGGRNRYCKECCVHLERVYTNTPTKDSTIITVNSYHNARELAKLDSLDATLLGVHVPDSIPTLLKLYFSQLRIEIHRGDVRQVGYDLLPTTTREEFVAYVLKVLEEYRTRLDEIYV